MSQTDQQYQPTPGNPASEDRSSVIGQHTRLIERFTALMQKNRPEDDRLLIERAIAFARATATSDETFRQLLATGIILMEMHIDLNAILAGMLQAVALDLQSNTVIPAVRDRIEQEFGGDIAMLIESIAHFNRIERRKGRRVISAPRTSDLPGTRKMKERDDKDRRQQIEAVQRMFVAMGDDPRIVIFRLADHLRQMRERNPATEEARILAQESRDIYAPLAGRLGMSRIECELDDRAFEQLEPDMYRRVYNLVQQVRAEQKDYIERVCTKLKDEAAKVGIIAEVSGRYKHYWSIYRKLLRNEWNIHQIYDLIAFRVIVPTLQDCYTMLGQVHGIWAPRADRIKDFISNKKTNGYQSLHTTVFCLDNRLAEIQIRTREMHENAEFGVATHWYYKDVGDGARHDKRLHSWLQQLRDWTSDLQQQTSSDELIASSREEGGTRAQVFVFTPHGDVKDLPYGSTPVDFAYRIHSNLGDHCAGARIITPEAQLAQRLVPLDYQLQNGEIIEIITRKDAHPTRDWLKFVKTSSARGHIMRYLKQHEKEMYINVGRDRFASEAKTQAGINDALESISEEILELAAQEFQHENIDDMFAAIGWGALRPSVVLQFIQPLIETTPPPPPADPAVNDIPSLPSAEVILDVDGARGLMGHLASCCHPIPEDPIIGYISRGRGIIVHHERCRSLRRLGEERFLPVDWKHLHLDLYDAAIIITGRDRKGLLRDVIRPINEMHINMGNVNHSVNSRGRAIFTLTLQISSQRQLEDAMKRIRQLGEVESVSRDERTLIS